MRASRRAGDRFRRNRNGMHWAEYLAQGIQWMTCSGAMVAVGDMSPGWRHNAARWLRRHAHWISDACSISRVPTLSRLPLKDRSRWVCGTVLYRALVGLPVMSEAGPSARDQVDGPSNECPF